VVCGRSDSATLVAVTGIVIAIVTATSVAAACSSTGASPVSAPATLDSAQRLVTLSDAERGMVCDWYAPRAGGYSRTIPCEASGIPMEIDDRATCIHLLELAGHVASELPNDGRGVGVLRRVVSGQLVRELSAHVASRLRHV